MTETQAPQRHTPDIPGQLQIEGFDPDAGAQDQPSDVEDSHERALPGWLTVRNAVIALVIIGLAARLASLGARPLHHDESLDAWFSWRYLNGTYDGYDPVYHGPLRFYITAAFFWMIGESITVTRLLAALAGSVVVGLPWFWRRQLGSAGVIGAVGLLAISPSMLYFSRVGREDAFFLAITVGTVLVLVAFLSSPRVWHPTAILTLLVAGMAVKESTFLTIFIFGGFAMVVFTQDLLLAAAEGQHSTAGGRRLGDDGVRRTTLIGGLIFMLVAFIFGEPIFLSLGIYFVVLLAALGWAMFDAMRRGVDLGQVRFIASLRTVPSHWWLTAVWTSILLFIALFTQFFTDFSGPESETAPYSAIRNGIEAGFRYWRGEQDTARGDARWQYYLAVIPAYEWFILALSAVGIGRVLKRPTLVGQTLVWWAIASFTVHSWAGERMPWLIIHPLFPFVVLGGLGVQVLWENRARAWRVPVGVALALGLAWTLNTSYQAAYVRGGEPQELFVQAGQATPDVPEWADRLYRLDRLMLAEEGRNLTVSIDSDVYWPYGWYLRDFPTGTFAVLETDSTAPDSDVIFVPHWEQAAIGDQLTDYTAIPYEHRWWWVPDLDVGVSSWARWLWDRTPWDGSEDDPSDCPGSLVGQVYIRNSVYQLEQTYLGATPPPAEKPGYGGPCKR